METLLNFINQPDAYLKSTIIHNLSLTYTVKTGNRFGFYDIFLTEKNTISTNYANQYFKDYRDMQYFMINLKYNFGNQKVKDAKAGRKTDEQNGL